MSSSGIPEQVLVLRGDGSVASVRGAPTTWLDRRVAELPLPEPVLKAAEELLGELAMPELAHRRLGGSPPTTLILHDAVPLRRSLVRVSSLVMRLLDVFATQAKSARVLFDVSQATDMPPVLHGDEEKLAWVLATLVGNALRIVSQPSREDVEPMVRLSVEWHPAAASFSFTVSDNGPGMSGTTAKWLFDRDPRTGKPIGLALLMVRDVVAAHRGTIEVESELGEGARFVVHIPRGRAT